ncbi:MAG: DUF2065 family protein [Paracoccaceae bacterium]
MDLLAALALVLVIEGLALAILAKSVPDLMAEMEKIAPDSIRKLGAVLVVAGVALYVVVRGGSGAG